MREQLAGEAWDMLWKAKHKTVVSKEVNEI